MADRERERAAITLFIDALREVRSLELAIAKDNPDDFPDFVLSRSAGGPQRTVQPPRLASLAAAAATGSSTP